MITADQMKAWQADIDYLTDKIKQLQAQQQAGEAVLLLASTRRNIKLQAEIECLRASLQKAVRLYETYGLIANSAECGEWVNDARDVLSGMMYRQLGYEEKEGDR